MAPPSEDVYAKISSEATTDFVQSYYPALESNRASISSYYSTPASTILFNGNAVADGNAVQDIFVNQMPATRYEVQSVDCQIINKQYPTPTTGRQLDPRKDMSILVIVSGHVRFGDSRDLPQRGFSETFVLVPNPNDTQKAKRRPFLIQTQNFRLVV
ncbi:hypothetical protein BJY04DRAFT_221175 [Aspergillus karnatakaensis]|uniref:putative nuclear transport factor 2 domain protein n=1 Tax=Aspergillus karnatakaensis TaxID=1810916 RepID=UPI003CCE4159